MKNNLSQIGLVGSILVLLVLMCDPFMLWMPERLIMLVLLVLTAFLCVWAGFIAMEKPGDERETLHKMNAGRIAYLLGLGTLTLALFVEGLAHKIDPWIVLCLGVMVLSRLLAKLYLERYR